MIVGVGTITTNTENLVYSFSERGIEFQSGVEVTPEPYPYWYFARIYKGGEFVFPVVIGTDEVFVPSPQIAGQYGLESGEYYEFMYTELVKFIYSFAPPSVLDICPDTTKIAVLDDEQLAHEIRLIMGNLWGYPLLIPVDILPNADDYLKSIYSSDREWFGYEVCKYADSVLEKRANVRIVDGYVVRVNRKFLATYDSWKEGDMVPWWSEYTLIPDRLLFVTTNERLAKIVALLVRIDS